MSRLSRLWDKIVEAATGEAVKYLPLVVPYILSFVPHIAPYLNARVLVPIWLLLSVGVAIGVLLVYVVRLLHPTRRATPTSPAAPAPAEELRRELIASKKAHEHELAATKGELALEKSGKKRVVVLHSVAREALLSIKRDRKIVSPYVFSSPQGKSLRNNFDKRYWRPALAEAKIPDFRFHDLRHTFASRLVAAGVHSLIVQKAGGWSDERMLQRYVHHDPNLIRAAVEQLAKAASWAREAVSEHQATKA